MVLVVARQSATVLLRMVLDLMSIRDERSSVQIIMCLLVSSSRELHASRIVLSSATALSSNGGAGERLRGGVCSCYLL